jgi:hypothetical protein
LEGRHKLCKLHSKPHSHKVSKKITLEEAWNKKNPDVSHFPIFGSVVWAHIPDEKRKYLHSKSDKCIFVRYSEYVKGFKLLQPYYNEIIIIRDVKFDEKLLSCDPNSSFVSSYFFILVSSSSNYGSEVENTPSLSHLLPNESIENEPEPTLSLLRWVVSTREVDGDIVGDPSYQCQTYSQFQLASSLLAQVLETRDPNTCA